MGIEELQKLPAEGIQAGLKGAGLRMWVDGERAKLMAQRDAQGQSLKAQREAESQRLEAEYEAEKEFQEKQIAMLNRQIAVLENLFKRKAAEVSSVIYMMEGHHKLEGIGEAGSEPRGPRREAAENIPHGNFRDDLQEYSTIKSNKSQLGTEKPNFEFQNKILAKKVESTNHESVSLHDDGSLPSENTVKEPVDEGTAYTQTDTSLFPDKTEHEASRSECSAEHQDFVAGSKIANASTRKRRGAP